MRPQLNDGDIWAAQYANAAGFPQMSGLDEYGHGPKIIDDWLDDGTNQIKHRFYSWQQRIQVQQGTGLQATYTGSTVMLGNGSTLALNAGVLTLPSNAAGFIYINEAGAVSNGPVLPSTCIPLASYSTNQSTITSLADLRYQVIDVVRPVRQTDPQSLLSVGDIKYSARVNPEAGWLHCDGASYLVATYPLLFDAIGTTYNQSGDSFGTFRVPDCRGRALIGSGHGFGLTNRPLGAIIGAEGHRLLVDEMPSHSHQASQSAHNHVITSTPHSHTVVDPGHTHGFTSAPHSHGVNDPGHSHTSSNYRQVIVQGLAPNALGAELSAAANNSLPLGIFPTTTGVSLQPTTVGGTIGASGTGVSTTAAAVSSSVSSANPTITINNQGGNSAHNNMPPSIAINVFIRAF